MIIRVYQSHILWLFYNKCHSISNFWNSFSRTSLSSALYKILCTLCNVPCVRSIFFHCFLSVVDEKTSPLIFIKVNKIQRQHSRQRGLIWQNNNKRIKAGAYYRLSVSCYTQGTKVRFEFIKEKEKWLTVFLKKVHGFCSVLGGAKSSDWPKL